MYPLDISIYFSLLLDRKNTEVLNRYLPKKNPTQKRDTTKPANSLLPSENSRPAQQKKHKGPTVASAVMSLPAMTFFARSVGCKWNGYFAGNYGHLRKYHHRENGVALGMVPLIINPTYTMIPWLCSELCDSTNHSNGELTVPVRHLQSGGCCWSQVTRS